MRNRRILLGLAMWCSAALLSQAELVAEWNFEEGSGTVATDSTGNGFDATVVNPDWFDGVEADTSGLQFDTASNSYVNVPAAAFATISDQISIAMWVYGSPTQGTTGNGNSAFGSNNRTIHSHLPWDNGRIYWDCAARQYAQATADQYKGKWNHFVFTKDTTVGDMKIYINGETWQTWTNQTTVISGITSFYIGAAAGPSGFYDGLIDDFQLYDHALTDEAVSNLYASVTPVEPAFDFAAASLSASVTSGDIPLEVVFDGAGSSSSTTITNYMWDFGNGTTANGALVTNIYTVGGIYTASLVVEDGNGNVATNTVEITAKDHVSGVELVVTTEGFETLTLPTLSTNDLAQTALLSSEGAGDGSATTDTDHAKLFDGTIGNDDGGIGGEGEVRWNSTSIVTVNFDVSENEFGYDITEISSIAGWAPGGGGRANQGYEIRLIYMDDSQKVLAGPEHWAPNDGDTNYWTKVTFVETNGLAMATGVKAVTFASFYNALAGGDVVGREIDIFGVPSSELVPQPDVPVLVTDGNLDSLSWEANGAFSYSVMTNSDLNNPDGWGTLMDVAGTPPTTTITLPAKTDSQLFYKVIAQ